MGQAHLVVVREEAPELVGVCKLVAVTHLSVDRRSPVVDERGEVAVEAAGAPQRFGCVAQDEDVEGDRRQEVRPLDLDGDLLAAVGERRTVHLAERRRGHGLWGDAGEDGGHRAAEVGLQSGKRCLSWEWRDVVLRDGGRVGGGGADVHACAVRLDVDGCCCASVGQTVSLSAAVARLRMTHQMWEALVQAFTHVLCSGRPDRNRGVNGRGHFDDESLSQNAVHTMVTHISAQTCHTCRNSSCLM